LLNTLEPQRGKFIVIDGLGRSGKSTATQLLKERFSSEKVMFTREPGGTPLSEKIRELILPEHGRNLNALIPFPLFWAARRAHIEEKIIPALVSGQHVVTDRFDSSTYAYQIFGEEKYQLKLLFELMREYFVLGDAHPTLYIFLDVAPEEALRRHQVVNSETANTIDIFDNKDLAFYQRVRKGFLEFMTFVNCHKIDANGPVENWFPELHRVVRNTLA
jgi:dTMP kinase